MGLMSKFTRHHRVPKVQYKERDTVERLFSSRIRVSIEFKTYYFAIILSSRFELHAFPSDCSVGITFLTNAKRRSKFRREA